MNRLRIFSKYWLPVILWAGVIFYFSSIPHLQIEELGIWDTIFRKIAHATEYGVLAFLALRLGLRQEKRKVFVLVIVIVFCALYAWSDEYHQSFVEGRTFAIWDIVIDSLGAIVFGLLYYRTSPKIPKPSINH